MRKMKKQVKIFIIVAIAILITGATVLAATIGKSNSSYVRIREQASTESNVLDVLMEGDQVEILGEEGDWYKVSAKGHTGYVSKAFITKADGTTAEPTNNQNTENNTTPETPDVKPATQTATITTRIYKVAEGTAVYILPILSSESIGTVNAGESIDLVNSTGLWGFVKTDKIKGWVRIDKLSSEEVTTTVEVPVEATTEQTTETTPEETTQANTTENNEAEQNTQTENTNTENNTEQNNAQSAENTENATTENTQTTIPETTQEQAQTNYKEKTMYVLVTAINVRKEANTNSEVISGAEINTAFTVVGEENGWYKVKVNGNNYGFIRKDLLSDSKTEVTSRSNTTDRAEAQAQTTTQGATPAATPATTTTQAATTAAAPATTQTASAPAATASTTAATTSSTTAAPAASSSGVTGADVVAYAQQFLGCSYSYGAAGPSSFDCSGFTMYVYKHFGYSLSHSSKVQATQGVAVKGELQPGDILVFSNDGKQVGHVGLYIGNDKFIHASDYSTGVMISNLHDSWNISKYWGARRIL